VLEKIDLLVVDKTGTLTEGKPRLVSVVPAEDSSETESWTTAGSWSRVRTSSGARSMEDQKGSARTEPASNPGGGGGGGSNERQDDLLRLAASLERASEHPLAAAVVAEARERKLELAELSDFSSLTGKGVTGTVGASGSRRVVAVGNQALIQELGIDSSVLLERAQALRRDGETVIFVAIDGRAAGILGVTDPIKSSAQEALRILQQDGVRVVMITG